MSGRSQRNILLLLQKYRLQDIITIYYCCGIDHRTIRLIRQLKTDNIFTYFISRKNILLNALHWFTDFLECS